MDIAIKADGRKITVGDQVVNLYNGAAFDETLIYNFYGNVNRPRRLLMDENENVLITSKTSLIVGPSTKGSSIVRFDKDCAFDPTFKCEVTYTAGRTANGISTANLSPLQTPRHPLSIHGPSDSCDSMQTARSTKRSPRPASIHGNG